MSRPGRTTHGDYGYARTHKCLCDPCVLATRRYHKLQTLRKSRGISDRHDAAPIRARLQPFLDAGISCDQIARATKGEVNHTQVHRLMYGNLRGDEVKFLYGRAARALSRVRFEDARDAEGFVSSVGLRRRLQALQYMGHTMQSIADELGIKEEGLWAYLTRDMVKRSTVKRVDDLYRRLSLVPGPNERVKWSSYRRDYAPPMAWDEGDIDNPNAEPDLSVIRCVVTRCHRASYKHSLCPAHYRRIPVEVLRDGRRFRTAVKRLDNFEVHGAGSSLRDTLVELKELGVTVEEAARRTGRAVSHVEKMWGEVA